jgi:hypothetical protein
VVTFGVGVVWIPFQPTSSLVRWWSAADVVVRDLGDRGVVVVIDVVCSWFSLILDSLTDFQIC